MSFVSVVVAGKFYVRFYVFCAHENTGVCIGCNSAKKPKVDANYVFFVLLTLCKNTSCLYLQVEIYIL
jgi:hypothetical protein